jgi:general secretion pathway protein G
MRVRIRDHDYLIPEAAELESMVGALRGRIEAVETAVAHVQVALTTSQSRLGAAGSLDDLEGLQTAVREAEAALAGFTTTPPAREPAAVPIAAPAAAVDTGFSLVELLIALAFVSSIAAIGLPGYSAALNASRVAGAIGDINAIGKDIAMFRVSHGCFPALLADIASNTLTDPWGRPYEYAIASRPGPPAKGGRGAGGGGGGGSCGACGGSCVPPGKARKDKNLVPINRDFDLYSVGRDGKTSTPLTAGPSKDDIIWGRDGGFIGLASEY